jgi:RND family efflux transporter MFP subunit
MWLALVCLGLAVHAGCHQQGAETKVNDAAQAELPVIQAETFVVAPSVLPTTVRSQGSLVADDVAVVGAKAAGRVAEVFVDVGDSVANQAQLAVLDKHEFELEVTLVKTQLVQARAALGLAPDDPLEQLTPQKAPPVREAQAVWDEAKTRTQRMQRLLPKNAVTQEDLDTALAAERVAEARHASALNGVLEKIALIRVRGAELALAEQRLADTIVVAPFEGQVHERHIAPGTFVQIGSPIVTLVRTGTLRYRGTLPERLARELAIGLKVQLDVETIDEPLTATVSRISPVVQESNRSLMFEVSVPNPEGRLRTGLFVEAEVFVDPNAEAIVIPPEALSEFAGAEKVWKVVEGVAQEQLVTTGRRSAAGIEITSGLSAGDLLLKEARQGRIARVQPPANSTTNAEPSPAIEAPTLNVTETSTDQ